MVFGSGKENVGLVVSKNNTSNKKPALSSKAYFCDVPSVLMECFGSLFAVSHLQQSAWHWDSEMVLVRWPWIEFCIGVTLTDVFMTLD